MTDDELIARVLAWETKKFPGSYIAALEFCHERDNELSQSAPDLARRLQKANERIAVLEAGVKFMSLHAQSAHVSIGEPITEPLEFKDK